MRRLFVSLLLLACAPAAREAARPNVVVIVVDDLRWDDIAVAGHPFVVYYGEVNEDRDGPAEACVPIAPRRGWS